MYYNVYNHHHRHSQDGTMINIEENGNSEAMQSSCYTQMLAFHFY